MTRLAPTALAPIALALALLTPAAPAAGTATPAVPDAAQPPRDVRPVLAFPEPGLDDSAAYQGYRTRFFRDAAGNTVQLYLDRREGRVVHLWADADNESLALSARDARGRPVELRWGAPGAAVAAAGRARTLEHRLVAEAPAVHLGWFLLGSMRVERDFQHGGHHRTPYAGPAFSLPEIDRLLAALDRLPAATRRRHLATLRATSTATLRARLRGRLETRASDTAWVARVIRPSLDGRDTLVLEVRADPRRVAATRAGDSLSLRARDGARVPFTLRVSTTATPLTPLARAEIFTPAFLAFLDSARAPDTTSTRARWLERQVRGVELLASREKLMAGLPTYATYFGRDMQVAALMMRPIWRDEMSEFAVAAVLRRLSPTGEVSHEEALGGQAVREAAAEYAALVDAHLAAARAGDRAAADTLLARAGAVLRDHRRTRENYHMIDDELQLPVLAARWLADPDVPAARKRAFLTATDGGDGGGGSRLVRLVRELALVARLTAPYAADPVATNLLAFPPRDSGWASASWRDSGAGYAGGRFAMDVNAILAPHALESTGRILDALRALGISADSLERAVPAIAGAPLGRYARDPGALRAAVAAWRGASRHFHVRLAPAEARARVAARLAALPAAERAHWQSVLAATGADRDSIDFLALALDAAGRPIGVANTDPATRLFLGPVGDEAMDPAAVLRDVRPFVRAYPVGLFVERVGPVVANDVYATPAVWDAFERDPYHGPRVVWGREVNLFLLGVADRIAAGGDAAYVRELRDAVARVRAAVAASGFRSELWRYVFEDGRPVPARYGSGADVQLWSTTDLAVEFALSRLGR